MKLYVIGLGPAAGKDMTLRAVEALNACQCLVGYKNFVNLIEADYPEKEMVKQEEHDYIQSSHIALQKTQEGLVTALVCAGDSMVRGFASMLFHVAKEYPKVDIEVVPGVTSASAGSALLGSPLSDDFVVMSLSQEGSNWDVIERRLMCAVDGGFVLCLYNPASDEGSHDHKAAIRKACRILLWKRKPSTLCGYVKNPGFWGQKIVTLTLEELFDCDDLDTFATLFIGNDQTELIHGNLVTARGFSALEALSTTGG